MLGLPLALVLAMTQLSGAGLAAGAASDAGSVSTYGRAAPTVSTRTIPYFSGSFSYAGGNYPYTMVGTNPRTSQATTVVRAVIVPLRFVFADGNVSEPGPAVGEVLRSPLFKPASFTSGITQYGDAIRRAMFWQEVARTNYHVLIAPARVLPTQTIVVPSGQGVCVKTGDPVGLPILGTHAAAPTGVVSTTWFGTGQTPGAFATLLAGLPIDPTEVVIVVNRNAFLSTSPIPYGAPLLGFHTAISTVNSQGTQKVLTAIWADYADPYTVQEFSSITQNIDG
jgi:hypothetical protein